MAKANFVNLRVYERLADESRFQPLIEERGPKLNAFLRSISKGSRGPRTMNN